MRIALVAGEISGDLLGAALIYELRNKFPRATFYGVAGPRMREAGCEAIESIEALSVMGLAEVLRHLPRLLRLRSELARRFALDRPDCVIGIDAPDFNLALERSLRRQGLFTVHCVSPSVWAWREGRVKTIAQAVDLMLCLLPFEEGFYRQRGLSATYIGHPLADELDDSVSAEQGKVRLGIPVESPVVAMLPGSRHSELHYLADTFAMTAAWLAQKKPNLRFVTPIAKPSLKPMMQAAITRHAAGLNWVLLDGDSRAAMQAADAVLLASGTATLECLLLGRPMVVAYQASRVSAWLMLDLGLLKIPHVSLPNLLCREPVVPELLRDRAQPQFLGPAVLELLQHSVARQRQLSQFDAVRSELKRGAARRAAEAIAARLHQ
ncbi:MAG: lipid-A-disaccharide synthase [Pseudomonadota bacterium]